MKIMQITATDELKDDNLRRVTFFTDNTIKPIKTMTREEFTNNIDGTINDYTTGIVNDREFRSMIMDTLIKVASPYLEYSTNVEFEYEVLKEHFKPSDKKSELAQFYTLGTLEVFFGTPFNPKHLPTNQKRIQEALVKLGAEISYYRMPYETHSKKGYWLEPTEQLLNKL